MASLSDDAEMRFIRTLGRPPATVWADNLT